MMAAATSEAMAPSDPRDLVRAARLDDGLREDVQTVLADDDRIRR
jgi:hypothetical protein